MIKLGEEDRRMLSLWQRGMRALSRRELASHRLLKTHRRECRPRAGETGMSYNDGAAFATTLFEICSLEALWIDAGWLQGMTESASCALREVQSGCWGVSMVDPGVSEEWAKKGVCRWREEIWVAVARAADYIARRPSHFGRLWWAE